MSSTEFNVDSLLDDINDVDISTPWGGSSHTSIRNAPLPPGSEKSLFDNSGIRRDDSYSRMPNKELTPSYLSNQTTKTDIKVNGLYPSHPSSVPREAFGASCSLSKVAGDRGGTSRSDTHSPKSRSNKVTHKGALCDDFDDDDDEWRSDSKHSKSSGDSRPSVGGYSYKKESTAQRDRDKMAVSIAGYSRGNGNEGAVSRTSQSSQGIPSSSSTSSSSFVEVAKTGHHIGDDEFADIEALFDCDIMGECASKDRDRDRNSDNYRTSSSSTSSSSSVMRQYMNADAMRPTATPLTCISKTQSSSSSSAGLSVAATVIPVTANTGSKARCTRIVLSGTGCARGVRSSVFSKCACDNLRCLSCNFKVHMFLGYTWNIGPFVDYMFFRNNTPNESKLSAQLTRSAAQCAYCCQCSWTATAEDRTLNQGVSGDPQWVCAGH